MKYFYEMKVLNATEGGNISTEKLKEIAKRHLADMIAQKIIKEAKAEMNPEGTYIIATWGEQSKFNCRWEVLEWPTP